MSFDFDAAVTASMRMPPGLRPLVPGTCQLTPTVAPQRGRARHLREKLAVLGRFADQALLTRPGFDATPALGALASQAAREHPEVLAFEGDTLHARALGWSLGPDQRPTAGHTAWPEVGACLAALPPSWRRAALLSLSFAEDFGIVDARDGSVPWLAVALPSMWDPAQVIGHTFADVHAPAGDDRRVDVATEQLVARVTSGPPSERFAWTITPHPRLHAHPRRVDPAPWPAHLTGDELAAQAWLRSERQTFIPMPEHRQAVFTIAVDTQPLPQAVATRERAACLYDALATMGPAVLRHRDLASVRDRLLIWLDLRR